MDFGIWDLNPRPFKHESSPITTRPGLPPCNIYYFIQTEKINLFVLSSTWPQDFNLFSVWFDYSFRFWSMTGSIFDT